MADWNWNKDQRERGRKRLRERRERAAARIVNPPRDPKLHPWRRAFNEKPKRTVGQNWETGEPLPNTIEYWVASAVRGRRGVVLDAAKTRELAHRLGIVDTAEPAEDQSAHRPIACSDVASGAYLINTDLAALDDGDGSVGRDDGDFAADDLGADE